MSKLSQYLNKFISFIVMLLMLVAFVSGQANAKAYQLASLNAADVEVVRSSHFRLEDE